MLNDLTGKQLVALTMGSTALAGGISGEHIHVISITTTFAGAIVLGFVWARAQVQNMIQTHAEEEKRLDEEREKRLLAEFRRLLAEHRANDLEGKVNGD